MKMALLLKVLSFSFLCLSISGIIVIVKIKNNIYLNMWFLIIRERRDCTRQRETIHSSSKDKRDFKLRDFCFVFRKAVVQL